MRVLEIKDPKDPRSISMVERDLPSPGEGEARVRITSIGLNRADTLYPEGRYFFKPSEGSRIGFEGAGIVDEVGAGCSLKPGQVVAMCPFGFSVEQQGCMAEYGIYKESSLISSPEGLDVSLAGSIWMANLTAWGGLVDAGELTSGETVVITAASSSVGIAAIQIANMLGATPIATTTSKEKAEALYEQGAKEVIVLDFSRDEIEKANDHYVEQIRKFTDGQGSDLVFDAVAGPASHGLIKASKRGGRIVIQGLLDRRPMDVHAGVLMKRLLTLRGYTLDQTLEQEGQKQRAIETLTEGFNNGALKPVISETFSLEDYQKASETLKLNKHTGKLVITP